VAEIAFDDPPRAAIDGGHLGQRSAIDKRAAGERKH